MRPNALALVIPCFNEEDVLTKTTELLLFKVQQLIDKKLISEKSKLFFVDDGSSDNTWSLIEKYYAESPFVCGIKLSRNRGHQNALLCGLLVAKEYFDVTISIDADLQDDIDVIDKMLEKYLFGGYEIVYGVRSNRESDSFLKRSTAQIFYHFMRLLGVDIVYNHADFRLMSKKALVALGEYSEANMFLRGIVPLLGFKSCVEYYKRLKRQAGTSKYPLRKMLRFALEGITSFSIKPIRMITLLGTVVFTVSIAMIIYFVFRYFAGHAIVGWASIACSLWGIGGLILFSIGIVGEYIGKIYLETKQRPRYHIEHFLFSQEAYK